MARLRNRMVKANFWTDGELLRWPREKRITYQGLWAIAEDSGCVEDDPFEWKLLLWPSPVDADITTEVLQQWRDEFVEAGKLLPYSVDGKSYLFVMNFHKHERPRNPQSPIVPLPPWITHEIREYKRATPNGMATFTRNEYVIDWDLLQENSNRTVTVPSPNNNHTGTLVLSSPVLSSPDNKHMSDDKPSDRWFGDVSEIFQYWQEAMRHPNARLRSTSKRYKAVAARLKEGYTVEQIKSAINGCRASPYHMGQNETGTVYDELELICRNDVKLESFMAKDRSQAAPQVVVSEEDWFNGD